MPKCPHTDDSFVGSGTGPFQNLLYEKYYGGNIDSSVIGAGSFAFLPAGIFHSENGHFGIRVSIPADGTVVRVTVWAQGMVTSFENPASVGMGLNVDGTELSGDDGNGEPGMNYHGFGFMGGAGDGIHGTGGFIGYTYFFTLNAGTHDLNPTGIYLGSTSPFIFANANCPLWMTVEF
jgi:hypothetical protein